MAITETSSTALGPPGAACRGCGAPLAADQRYCLSCGTRRAEARVPFYDVLGVPTASGAPVAEAPAPAARASGWDRVGGPWLAAGLVVVTLGVGVLIGRAGRDRVAPVVQRAPVVNVQSAAPAASSPTPVDAAADDGGAEPAPKDGGSSDAGAAEEADGGSRAAEPTVSKDDLARQQQLSGKDYSEQSKKLPKETALPGKAPEKDDKAPGGGAEAETIG